MRIKLQRHNSESKARPPSTRIPELKRRSDEEFLDTRINTKMKTALYGSSGSQQLNTHGSHTDLKSYKTMTLRKPEPRNFLTLNIEPIQRVDLEKAKLIFGIRLRGV